MHSAKMPTAYERMWRVMGADVSIFGYGDEKEDGPQSLTKDRPEGRAKASAKADALRGESITAAGRAVCPCQGRRAPHGRPRAAGGRASRRRAREALDLPAGIPLG